MRTPAGPRASGQKRRATASWRLRRWPVALASLVVGFLVDVDMDGVGVLLLFQHDFVALDFFS